MRCCSGVDSMHGRFPGTVEVDGKRSGDQWQADRRHQPSANPANLPHGDMGVDIVLECTGFFTDRA